MFCNHYGDILRRPFSVKNSPDGVKYLVVQATRSCRRRGIKKNHIFFGGEDANSYAKNLVNTLRSKGGLLPALTRMMLKNSGQIYKPVPIAWI